jgi:site-specific DNA-methyltransferase (cytosine-N4-specific)
MPRGLVEFFIDYLSDEGDLVADCFGGSNTVGVAAQQAGRRWISVERESTYLVGSMGRFFRRQDRVLAHNLPYRDYLRMLPG